LKINNWESARFTQITGLFDGAESDLFEPSVSRDTRDNNVLFWDPHEEENALELFNSAIKAEQTRDSMDRMLKSS
jgi:hypothetical protein